MSVALAVLERHAGRLEGELAAVRARLETVEGERDAERAKAGRIEVLEAILKLERERLADAQAEAGRWQTAATTPRGIAALVARFIRSPAA
jgi:phage terminase Nu1 subunit (DNA packaging protein)